jgi:hypothetical protein
MHDAPLNQATGLMGLACNAGCQLVGMASHGDDPTELPLLWQLCTALVGLGFGVTVLDATKNETANDPGLLELLEYRFGYGASEAEAPEWTVIPAAQGLHSLCNVHTHASMHRARNLERLGQLFGAQGVVILYAGVDWIVQLLGGTHARPVLTVSEEKNSLLTSYLALKRLLLKGGLRPTILHMTGNTSTANPCPDHSVAGHLTECARNFLNYDVQTIPIDVAKDGAGANGEMRRLSMRLLEGAVRLSPSVAANGARARPLFALPEAQSRSH